MKKNIVTSLFCILLIISGISAQNQKDTREVSLSSDDYLYEGMQAYNAEDYKKAVSLFKQAVKLNPDADAAYYYLGIIATKMSSPEDAEMFLRKALSLDSSNFWYRVILARFYTQTGETDKAIALYEKIHDDFPSKTSVYYEVIELYAGTNQIDKALETLDIIESLRGADAVTGYARYQLLVLQQKYAEAQTYLEEYNQKFPSPENCFLLGDLYKSQFKDAIAFDYYSQALKLDPEYTPAHFGLAEVYRIRSQYRQYFDHLYIFMADSAMSPTLKTTYMTEFVMNPQFVSTFQPQVDTIAALLLSAHPTDSSVLNTVGSYYVRSGQTETGDSLYKRNVELYPTSQHLNIEYFSLLFYEQRWSDLAEQARSALQNFPDDPSILEIAAIAYWRNDEIHKAIDTFHEILRRTPDSAYSRAAAYTSLGDLYQEAGDRIAAEKYYKKGYKADPTSLPLLNNYAYFLSKIRKNLSKALAMSKITIRKEPDNPTYLDTYAWLLYLTGELEDAKGYFKHAMVYGGKESPEILAHYAELLDAMGDSDMSQIYREQAEKLGSEK